MKWKRNVNDRSEPCWPQPWLDRLSPSPASCRASSGPEVDRTKASSTVELASDAYGTCSTDDNTPGMRTAACKYYEGHPINKLLIGIILLIVKTWKIRDIRFVENLFLSKCCEFCYDDVTVTSVINIKYGDVTVESIPQWTAFCHSFSLGERT